MKKIIGILVIKFFVLFSIFSISIWNDKAKNIYNRKVYYKVGDSLEILVDEYSTLKYKSSSKYLKSYRVDLSGGEMTGVFTFVPNANVEESKSGKDNDELAIQSVVQARVTGVTDDYITVTGRKSISNNNKTSVIEISGDANLSDISGNSIISNKLINPSLTITTLVENDANVINARDFVNVVLNPDSTGDKIEETRFSEDRKRAMLTEFFNKILNVIF